VARRPRGEGEVVTARTIRHVACIGALKLYGLALAALLCDWMSR
jgi:hypothetical protein